MKCPYRVNETYSDENYLISKTSQEFAECYGQVCPFFKRSHTKDLCLKVQAEVSNGQTNS